MSENATTEKRKLPTWVGPAIFLLTTAVVVLLGLLAVSIMERRWEAQRPAIAVQPIAPWEPDNAVWGRNYPREYQTYLRTSNDATRTLFGGGFPRDYLEDDPLQVILFAGYPFSKEYRQARGHYHALADVTGTKRVDATTVATCWTCKSTDVPKLMSEMGVNGFYRGTFDSLRGKVTHPIGCQDCHDPATMNLRITRPALREAFAAMGKDIDAATHQETRSLVCAQCHVEYYFKDKYYLTFPWAKGTAVENMLVYYDQVGHTDYVHAVSRTPIIKAQHPDYEVYLAGVHAYRGVACADCHMPYLSEGGVKFTDHHVRSPLLNIANSCAVCHRWSEEEVRRRVEAIQTKVASVKKDTEIALVQAHFDIAAVMQAGASDDELAPARKLVREAQFRWDYVSANNGLGFHAPQECTRILANAIDRAQQARLLVARILAAKGVAKPASHPDVSTREKAAAVMRAFEAGEPVKML